MNPRLNAVQPIVKTDGTMEQAFRTWTLLVNLSIMLDGAGSPEGVVEALPKQLYMDTAGTAGAILYIKRDADVGGDTSQGWILV